MILLECDVGRLINIGDSFDAGLKSDGTDGHCAAKLHAFICASRYSLSRKLLGVYRKEPAVE
jgi:hypothetical protein